MATWRAACAVRTTRLATFTSERPEPRASSSMACRYGREWGIHLRKPPSLSTRAVPPLLRLRGRAPGAPKGEGGTKDSSTTATSSKTGANLSGNEAHAGDHIAHRRVHGGLFLVFQRTISQRWCLALQPLIQPFENRSNGFSLLPKTLHSCTAKDLCKGMTS